MAFATDIGPYAVMGVGTFVGFFSILFGLLSLITFSMWCLLVAIIEIIIGAVTIAVELSPHAARMSQARPVQTVAAIVQSKPMVFRAILYAGFAVFLLLSTFILCSGLVIIVNFIFYAILAATVFAVHTAAAREAGNLPPDTEAAMQGAPTVGEPYQ